MNEALITVYVQVGQHLDLLLIFHSGGDGRDTRIVGCPADRSQEGGIGARLHDLAGIAMIHLDVGRSQLLEIPQGLKWRP